VAVELYLGAPLFPGADNLDQIYRIFNILGEPTEESWPKGAQKFNELGFKSEHKGKGLGLGTLLKTASHGLADLIEKMLVLNPKKRISSWDMLAHDYFSDIRAIVPPETYQRYLKDLSRKNRNAHPSTIARE
jgi:serine/threonine protein kinase